MRCFAGPRSADDAVNLAVLEGVGQIFQYRLFKGLVPQREVLREDVNLEAAVALLVGFSRLISELEPLSPWPQGHGRSFSWT